MSHRVHPKAFRIREMKDWDTRGFYEKSSPKYLEEDLRIRQFLEKKLDSAGIAKIEIERFPAKINIIVSTSRPGLIIGRGGEAIEQLKKRTEKLLFEKRGVKIEIKTIKNPWASAVLASQWMAQQLEKRVPYRRVLKQALSKIMSNKEVKGAKVQISGRLDGVTMSRREWLMEGRLPRQTLRSNIDYGFTEALCTYGVLGVKVWIYLKD